MPASQMDSQFSEAFAVLEESFKNSSFLQAYKALPSRQTTEKADSPTRSDFSEDDDDSDYSDGSMHEGYRPQDAPAISLMRSNSTLPPTPPTRSRDSSGVHSHLVPLPKDNGGTNTPPSQQIPPTPELTPPDTRIKSVLPLRPAMPHYTSSRAESFTTAKEHQSQTSAHTSRSSLALRPELSSRWLNATRSMRLGELQLGLVDKHEQLQDSTSDSRDATPTQVTAPGFPVPLPTSSPLIEYITPEDLDRHESSTPESVDARSLRNVTIRKKRACNFQPQTTPDQKSPDNQERNLFAHMSQSHSDTASPSTRKDDENLDWPEVANDYLYRHIRDEKSKRLSSVSNNSTVVEAIVLAAPGLQQRQPTLRRVSGVDTLRTGASSKRSSIDSAYVIEHRLKHRISPLPGRKHLVDDRLDTARSVSNPEAAYLDKVPVIVIPERRSSHGEVIYKLHLLTFQQNRLYRPKHSTSLAQDFEEGNISQAAGHEFTAGHNRFWLNHASSDSFQQQSRTTLRHVSAPVQGHNDFSVARSRNTFRHINGTDAKVELPVKQGWKRHSVDNELESPELRYSPKSFTDQIALDDKHSAATKQDNPSTWALYEYSLQSSPRKSSEVRDARHLHPGNTPTSQMSDRTDPLEVNEAKAVNLYQHDNTSLLMIQHVAKRRMAEAEDNPGPRSIDELITPNKNENRMQINSHPAFQAIIQGPDTPSVTESVDRSGIESPLRNPRTAPEPPKLPAIIFSPATPISAEHDKAPPEPEEETTQSRRPSLVEKARRYSETLIQPFLPRTLSRHSAQKSTHTGDRGLHPFWQPRGFWDDFSSDEEDYEDEALPQGGDTSDMQSLKSISQRRSKLWNPRRLSVRLPGFMGTGGFMQGNTLGLSRHGTNTRRHQIAISPSPSPSSSPSITKPSNKPRTNLLTRILPFPTLRKRKSTDFLRAAAQSTESLRRLAQRQRRRRFRDLDKRFGIGALKSRVRRRKDEREKLGRERLREEMKKRIGSPVYLET